MFPWGALFGLASLIVLHSSSAYGHGGGLDQNGGHYNRKTGEYHMHRPQPPAERSAAPSVRPFVSAPAAQTSSSVTFSTFGEVKAGLAYCGGIGDSLSRLACYEKLTSLVIGSGLR